MVVVVSGDYNPRMLSEAFRARIDAILDAAPVVLFMKGTRAAPQCGYSAKTVDLLDEHLDTYVTYDVLADAELREGMKTFSAWQTFPQLYVDKTFVGGADIVRELHQEGALRALLQRAAPGAERRPRAPLEIHVTEAAVAAFRRYAGVDRPRVRLEVARDFDVLLDVEDPRPGDLVLDLGHLELAVDPKSQDRAHGMTIDFVTRGAEEGFRIDNPNKPPSVKLLSASEYLAMRATGKPHLLLDVRPEAERMLARIVGSERLDDAMMERLMDLDRATAIVCQCHHGVRSRSAAEQLVAIGFRDVYNLEGGIEAFSDLDRSIPKY